MYKWIHVVQESIKDIHGEREEEREREILRNWLTLLRPASLKSVGQAAGWRAREELESRGHLEAEFPLTQGNPVFFLKAFN